MIPPKEIYKAPVNDPKEVELYSLPDKEFKIFILKKLNEIQETVERQLNKMVHEQNDKFNKETEAIIKNQTKTQELNNTMTELKISIEF